MSKKKIADSIIIRVGGGIREIPRESVEPADKPESTHLEPGFEQKEEVPQFGVELDSNTKIVTDKIIN